MTLLLYAQGSVLAVPTTVYGVASYLYNSPLYRGKRYFPANLKLEGLWGGSAFLLGVLAAAMPQLADLGSARVDGARLTSTMERLPFSWRYGPDVAVAALLAFGGWSLLASLKDEKDVEIDAELGVQTLFTLGRRRDVSAEVVARWVRGVALACLLIAAWAPLAIARSDAAHAIVMSLLALPIALYRGRIASHDFRARLVALSVLLGVLAHGLSGSAAPVGPSDEPTPPEAPLAAPPRLEPVAAMAPGSSVSAPLPPLDETVRPRQALERLGARETAVARSDYGRAIELDGPILEISPTSVLDVQSAVRQARRGGMAIRVRGRGHSTNGGSVAREGELSIVTTRMRRVCRTSDESVTVDAGVAVVHVDRFLAPYGLRLRVSNDGPAGPSVGGYISAGGFGSLSPEYGGLWSQVRSVTIVDGTGAQRVLTPSDDAFRWLFGSVGQLGVIIAAEMNVVVVPRQDAPSFPVGRCESIPYSRAEEQEGQTPVHSWWTLMVEPGRFEEARSALAEIQERHASGLHWVEPYRYSILHREIRAPLVTPVSGDVVACGIWIASSIDEHRAARAQIDQIEAEVEAMARAHGFRRYLSAERSVGPAVWRANLGEEIYDRFRLVKASFDPDHLFGRGVVFDPPTR
jgi:FAD/FMN-containing dehydrogenase